MIDPHDEILIREFASDACDIVELKRIGELSSEAKIYLLDCKDGPLKVAKVSDISLAYEISLMRDAYIMQWRICPEVYKANDNIIIMEYIPMTLSRWLADLIADVIIKKQRRNLHEELNRVVESLVDKLFKFHQRYSHNDLHSNNILVNPATLECFIIDFQINQTDKFQNLKNLQESFYIYPIYIIREYNNEETVNKARNIIEIFSKIFTDKIKKKYL